MIDHEKYSAPVARVYQDANDKILQALARRFSVNSNLPTRPETFEAAMLAQVHAVKREAAAIVQNETAKNAGVVDEAIRTSMIDTLEDEEPELERAADEGLVEPPDTTIEESIEERAKSMSATTKALLVAVGLSMVSSAVDTYRNGVRAATGAMRGAETIYQARPTTPVPSEAYDYRAACKAAVRAMVDSGVTGFVDRAGRHWSPEAYTSMVIKTTIGNAATQAVLDRNAEYGNSLISVRTNATARPGCAPWQGTVIDFADEGGTVTDGHGGSVYAYPVSATSYGQAAGIFGGREVYAEVKPREPYCSGVSVKAG